LHIEERKWEITGTCFDKDPIYDTDDDINKNLVFWYLPYDPRGLFESSMDTLIIPQYTIISDDEPRSFPPFEYDHEEEKLICCDPSWKQSLHPSHYVLEDPMKHCTTEEIFEE